MTTCKIQQEIEETSEREKEYVRAGKLETTPGHERVADAKVFIIKRPIKVLIW